MSPLEATRIVLAKVPAPKVLVAVSGGKDSLATLDVCVRRYGAKNVTGFLMELVPGLECEWRTVRSLEKRFGVTVVGVPHHDLSRLIRSGVYRPDTGAHRSMRLLKQADTEAYLRKLTGIEWVAWGIRSADSIVRNAYLKRIQGIDAKTRRVFPIWTWTKADVYGYLRAHKLPIPKMVGGTNYTGGVTLDAPTLSWIKAHFPQDFARILQVFPYAGAAVFRHDAMGIDPVADAKAAIKATRAQAAEEKARAQAESDPAGEGN